MRQTISRNITRADFRFIIGLLVTHAVFFVIALNYKRIYNGDSFEYIYMGLNIKDHFWFYAGNSALPITEEYMTLRPPLYSMMLSVIYMFTVNNWVMLVIQNIVSIFNIYYLRDTIRKMGYSRKYDWILIAFVLINPSQFIHTNTIAPDIFLQTSVLIYFRHFVLLIKRKDWKHGLWISLALTAGLLLKPVLYPFAYLHIIMLIIVAAYIKRGYLRPILVGAIPIAVVLLYSFWNYTRTDKFHYTSTQSFNAVSYYYYYYAHKEGIPKAQAFLQAERDKMNAMPEFKDRYDYANERGITLLKENFWPYMYHHTTRGLRMFIDPGKGDYDMFTGRATLGGLYSGDNNKTFSQVWRDDGLTGIDEYIEENPSVFIAMIVLMFNFLRLIGLALYLFNRRTNKYIKLCVVVLLGYIAITTGPIANTRYFMPISLIVIGCATIGYKHFLHWRKYRVIITEN